MKKLVLIEVQPPYDTDAIDCDENNPNVWNVEFWEKWLESIDYVQYEWSSTLYGAKELEVTDGHRGVRIGEKHKITSSWYYNISMGYKIEK